MKRIAKFFLLKSINYMKSENSHKSVIAVPTITHDIFKNSSKFDQDVKPKIFDFSSNKIAYAILVYERYEYLVDTIDSILTSDIDQIRVTFFFIDDGSKDPRIKEYLNNLKIRFVNLRIQVIFEDHLNGTAGATINRAIRIMNEYGNFDLMGWGDPDCIYNKSWLKNSLFLFQFTYNYNELDIRFFSSYNSITATRDHKVIKEVDTPMGKTLIRRQTGMANVMIRKNDLIKIGLFYEDFNDETLWVHRLKSLNMYGACPSEGLIEHIGEDSVLNKTRRLKFRKIGKDRADFSQNLSRVNWPLSIGKYRTFSTQKFILDKDLSTYKATTQIDIAIVCHRKDFQTLKHVAEGIRLNLMQPIGTCFLITTIDSESISLANQLDFEIIDENYFFPYTYNLSLEKIGGEDRSGWIKQQFIKLSADMLGDSDNILVIDADTVILKPRIFSFDSINLLEYSEDYHNPYFAAYQRILGRPTTCKISFITHSMIFNKNRLKEMKVEIEAINQMVWHKAIYLNLDLTENSSFSEYELYAHWMIENYPNEVVLKNWSNLPLDRKVLVSIDELQLKFGNSFESVSFHSYLN